MNEILIELRRHLTARKDYEGLDLLYRLENCYEPVETDFEPWYSEDTDPPPY